MNTLPEENLVVIQLPSQADRSKNSRNSQAAGCDASQIEWSEPDELSAIGEHKEYPVGAFPYDVANAILEVTEHGKMPTAIAAGSALSAPTSISSGKNSCVVVMANTGQFDREKQPLRYRQHQIKTRQVLSRCRSSDRLKRSADIMPGMRSYPPHQFPTTHSDDLACKL